MTSAIANQNKKENIDLLLAQRKLYGRAKLLMGTQIFVLLSVSIASLLLVDYIPKPIPSIIGLTFLLFDIFLFNPYIEGTQKKAAAIRELFDCRVLGLPWPEFSFSDKPTPESIFRLSKGATDKQVSDCQNWYPVAADRVPFHVSRILCQRASVVWGLNNRNRIKLYLTVLAMILIVLLGWTLISFKQAPIIWFRDALLPLGPILLRTATLFNRYIRSNETLKSVKSHLDRFWSQILDGANEIDVLDASSSLQSEIRKSRINEIQVPDWFYWVFRSVDESAMNVATDQLAEEFLTKQN